MNTKLLFPHRFRLVGWLIFVPSALLGLACWYGSYTINWLDLNYAFGVRGIKVATETAGKQSPLWGSNNLTDELAGIGVIVGLLFIGFSREKIEDEMSGQLRLEALQWSVYANYLVLIVAMLTVYDSAFFEVLIYNMFTLLLVFIVRYRWLIWRNNALLSV